MQNKYVNFFKCKLKMPRILCMIFCQMKQNFLQLVYFRLIPDEFLNSSLPKSFKNFFVHTPACRIHTFRHILPHKTNVLNLEGF